MSDVQTTNTDQEQERMQMQTVFDKSSGVFEK